MAKVIETEWELLTQIERASPETHLRKRRRIALDHYETLRRVDTLSDGTTLSEDYSVGDAVFIDPHAIKVVYLQSPMLVANKKLPLYKINDGLPDDALIGIVIDIYQDEKDRPFVRVHWLYRPRVALQAWSSPKKKIAKPDLEDNELIYGADPWYYKDYISNLKGNINNIAFKNSQAQDAIPAEYVSWKTRLTSDLELAKSSKDIWLVKKFWNPLPDEDKAEDFLQEFDFAHVHGWGTRNGWWEIQPDPSNILADLLPADTPQKKRKDKKNGQTKRKRDFDSDEEEETSSSEDEVEANEDLYTSKGIDELSEDDSGDGSTDDEESESDGEESSDDSEDDDLNKASPSKKRANNSPRKGRGNIVQVSAAQRKVLEERLRRSKERAKKREERKQACSSTSMQDEVTRRHEKMKTMEPWARARMCLHVSATPKTLPCREDVRAEIDAFLDEGVGEGRGGCLYVCGCPGTGKTATVRNVIDGLQEMVDAEEMQPFKFTEINSLKLPEPDMVYVKLWQFLSGETGRVSSKAALQRLEQYFQVPQPDRETCVVLVDEIDQLLPAAKVGNKATKVKKKGSIIYNLFNWPTQPHSKLILIAIANTIDLPERHCSRKVQSRLAKNKVTFVQYTNAELERIVQSRLDEAGSDVFTPAAVRLAGSKTARITGDARRTLDLCRQALETVERANEERKKIGLPAVKVDTKDVTEAHNRSNKEGFGFWIGQCSLQQQVLVLACAMVAAQDGHDQISLEAIINKQRGFLKQNGFTPIPDLQQTFSLLQSLAASKIINIEENIGLRNRHQTIGNVIKKEDLLPLLRVSKGPMAKAVERYS